MNKSSDPSLSPSGGARRLGTGFTLLTLSLLAMILFAMAFIPAMGTFVLLHLGPLWWLQGALVLAGLYLFGRLLTPALIRWSAATHEIPPGPLRNALTPLTLGTGFPVASIAIIESNCAAYFAGLGPTKTIFLGQRVGCWRRRPCPPRDGPCARILCLSPRPTRNAPCVCQEPGILQSR